MTRPQSAALATLVILQTIMLGALYAHVPPHPPAATPLFGIAPFLGAAIAAAVAALMIGEGRAGSVLGALAAVMALISFGPQKYFDPQFALIWPAVIAGQIAAATVIYQALPRRTPAPDLPACMV